MRQYLKRLYRLFVGGCVVLSGNTIDAIGSTNRPNGQVKSSVRYYEGLTKPIELKYGVDLRGEFSNAEVDLLDSALSLITRKVNPFPKLDTVVEKQIFEEGYIQLADARTNFDPELESKQQQLWQQILQTESDEERKRLITLRLSLKPEGKTYDWIRVSPIDSVKAQGSSGPLKDYLSTIIHEFGHIITLNDSTLAKTLQKQFAALDGDISDSLATDGKRLTGHVSDYTTVLDRAVEGFGEITSEYKEISQEFHREYEEARTVLLEATEDLEFLCCIAARLPGNPRLPDYQNFIRDVLSSNSKITDNFQNSFSLLQQLVYEWQDYPEEEFYATKTLQYFNNMKELIELDESMLGFQIAGLSWSKSMQSFSELQLDIEKSILALRAASFSKLDEDIADTFTYYIGNHHFADTDSIVREKVKILDYELQKSYGQ